MSDFIFLFKGDPRGPDLSPEEMQIHMQKWATWIETLAKAGTSRGGFPLDRGGKVVSGPHRQVMDGPFVESKEIVGGYLVITAADLDAAVGIAMGCPIFEAGGKLEVRAIWDMKM